MNFEPIIGSIILGLLTIVIGFGSFNIVKRFERTKIPSDSANWNKNHVMEISLFITGCLIWIVSYALSKYQIKPK